MARREEGTVEGASAAEYRPLDSVARWHKLEREALALKLEDARLKIPAHEVKIAAWDAMTEKQRRKRCEKKLKQIFNRPRQAMLKLVSIGDDLAAASAEDLAFHRLQRIIDAYHRQLTKVEEFVEAAKDMADEYPDIAEVAGGFIWTTELSPVKGEDNSLQYVTSNGVKSSPFDWTKAKNL